MKIPIDVIAEALDRCRPELHFSRENMAYSRLRLVQGAQWAADTLYVGYGRDIPSVKRPAKTGFISIGKPAAVPDNMICLPGSCDLNEIFNTVQKVFDSFSAYEIDLMRAVHSGSYQDLIDMSHEFLANPVYFMDNGYRVLAWAPDKDVFKDREWEHIRHKGFVSFETIRSLKELGHFDEMKAYKSPTIFSSPAFPFRAIISNAYIKSVFAGRTVAIEARKPFSGADILVSKMLIEAIEVKMSKDEAFQHIRGKGPLYGMFHDLVYGVDLDRRLIADRLQYLPHWKKGLFRVLLVPLGSADDQTFDYYASILERRRVDGCSILFENGLVVVLHYTGEAGFQPLRKALDAFLSDNALRAGLSNEFSNLSELRHYYKQAAATLELSGKDRQLNLYGDYTLKHILSFSSHENVSKLCHPCVLSLKNSDEENGTQFFKTLRSFLENERSLVKTAGALNIHRNTLLYRIDKIKEMTGVDLDDADTRLHVVMSYRLLEYF